MPMDENMMRIQNNKEKLEYYIEIAGAKNAFCREIYYDNNYAWDDREELIAKNDVYSFLLSKMRGKRFLKGESSIAKNPILALEYAIMFMKFGECGEIQDLEKVWPDGAEAISKNAYTAFRYATEWKNERWEKCEEVIEKDLCFRYMYNEFLRTKNNERWRYKIKGHDLETNFFCIASSKKTIKHKWLLKCLKILKQRICRIYRKGSTTWRTTSHH